MISLGIKLAHHIHKRPLSIVEDGLATHLGLPHVETITQLAGTKLAQATRFGENFNRDDDVAHTVSIKFCSTRLKMTLPRKTTTSINTKLYDKLAIFREPAPRNAYRKDSTIDVIGFSRINH